MFNVESDVLLYDAAEAPMDVQISVLPPAAEWGH